MKVNREAFLACLESVQAGLATREFVEQSSCFVFSRGRLLTYNDEVSCNIKSPLGKEVKGAVQAKPLLELLRKSTQDEMRIEVGEGELLINGKGGRSGVRMEAEVTLPIEQVEPPGDWKELHADFLEAINLVQRCASKVDAHMELTHVHLHPKWIESSDASQMARWRIKTGVAGPTTVRQSAIKHLTSLGVHEFSETPNWLHYRNPNELVVSCRRYMDEYPDLSPEFAAADGLVPVVLPKGLIEASDRAIIFSADNLDGDHVRVELTKGRVRLVGEGVCGWHRESKKSTYDGPDMSFLIAPAMLKDIVREHNECEVNGRVLRITAGKYIYLSCLVNPEERQPREKSEEAEE